MYILIYYIVYMYIYLYNNSHKFEDHCEPIESPEATGVRELEELKMGDVNVPIASAIEKDTVLSMS